MRPHPRSTKAHRSAAQAPSDPAAIARRVLENAQPYDAYPGDAAPLLDDYHVGPGQPYSSCFGSIGSIAAGPFTTDTLNRRIRPYKPYAPSPGINQGFVRPAQHPVDFSHQSALYSNSAIQIQTRRLLEKSPSRDRAQRNTNPRAARENNGRARHSPFRGLEAGSAAYAAQALRNYPQSSSLSPPSVNSMVLSRNPHPCTYAPNAPNAPNDTSSNPRPQSGQKASSNSSQNNEFQWVHHDMVDPTARSLRPRSNQDYERADAMREKGGACLPCRQARTRCDSSDHCQRCIHINVPSEEEFLASVKSTSPRPGLEEISLCQIDSPAVLDDRSLAETDSGMTNVKVARRADSNHAHDHVNRWFKKVTRMIDPKPFKDGSFTVQREVSLKITSGPNGDKNTETTETSFSLAYFDISCHLELLYWLTDHEDSLVAAFLGHPSAPKPPAPGDGEPRSRFIKHLSLMVTNIVNFLQNFEEANVYAAISGMPVARATVSIIYASFYRLLLDKGHALCSFVLASLQQKFRYCIRGTFKTVVEDSLRALAEYHRVLKMLAGPRFGSSSEAAALFQGLRDRAADLLLHRGTERLFLRVYNQLKVEPKRTINNTSQSMIEDLINRYYARPSAIKPLSIALRVNSIQSDIAPVPTEAFRDTDPYHHHRCIKVRDLLKESESSVTDPKQILVDGLVDNFDFLGHWPPQQQSEPWKSGASLCFGELPFNGSTVYTETQSLSTSLDREHASERPSQDDTDLESIKSESTAQDFLGLDLIFDLGATPVGGAGSEAKASPDLGWQHVLPGKSCKRRKGSGDSSNSDDSAGRGGRKHVRSGSPPAAYKHNFFGVLTGKPTRLP